MALGNDSHIWCPNCEGVVPLLRDYMPMGANNDHAATDLLCIRCGFVIATIHHLEPTDAQVVAARDAAAAGVPIKGNA